MERNLLNKEIQNLDFFSKMNLQSSVQLSGAVVPANSRRIFVANTEPFKSLPKAIRDKTIEELKRLFSFVSGPGQKAMTISLTEPSNYPEALSFSDAVVAVVPSALYVQPYLDEALKIQGKNASLFFSQLTPSITYTNPFASPNRTAFEDLGGKALQNKHIHRVASASYAIPYMAATVALDYALEKAVEIVESTIHVAKVRERRKDIFKNIKYWGTYQALRDTGKLSVIDNPKDPSKWLLTEELGFALGRNIAHEIRHLYLAPHAKDGLGKDSPEMLAVKTHREFSAVDKTNILKAIMDLEKIQGTIRVIPTFPLQQRSDFPF